MSDTWFNIVVYKSDFHKGNYKLTYQKSPHISLYAKKGNKEKNKHKAYKQTCYITKKCGSGFSKTMQYAGHSGRNIHKWTYKTQGQNK